jgi:hypothetical protein
MSRLRLSAQHQHREQLQPIIGRSRSLFFVSSIFAVAEMTSYSGGEGVDALHVGSICLEGIVGRAK